MCGGDGNDYKNGVGNTTLGYTVCACLCMVDREGGILRVKIKNLVLLTVS